MARTEPSLSAAAPLRCAVGTQGPRASRVLSQPRPRALGPSVGMIDKLSTSWLGIKHDPEKGEPVFGKDHAQTKSWPSHQHPCRDSQIKKTDAAAGSFM